MQDVVKDLTAHCGGVPSATQRALIDRAAWLTLHMALMDARAVERTEGISERDSRTYIAWSNCLSRTMRAIGLKGVAVPQASLRERLMMDTEAAAV